MFTPAFRLTSDFVVVTSRVRAFKSTWPVQASRYIQRLTLAQDLASTPGAVEQLDADHYKVRSQSNPDGAYTVTLSAKSCTCPDHGAHAARGVICKHRLAVALFVGWGEPTPEEQQRLEMQARQAAKRAGYIAFLQNHPAVSPNRINFAEFCQYPREGVVTYNHPLQGEINIRCLAGYEFHRDGNQEAPLQVQVIALEGTGPFNDGIFTTCYLTTAAERFTPDQLPAAEFKGEIIL